MLPSFDKLSRMLIQEKRLEYKNKTVLGGFEKLAPNWSAEALQEVTTEEERQLVEEITQNLYDYPDVPDEARPNFLHRILVKLHKVGEEASNKRAESDESKAVSPAPPAGWRESKAQPEHPKS